jgi:hypothetical protein
MDARPIRPFVTKTFKATKGLQVSVTTGSMADVPKDLLSEIKKLEEIFTVDTALLKKITNHFINELDKGKLMNAIPRDPSLTASRIERRWRQYCKFLGRSLLCLSPSS